MESSWKRELAMLLLAIAFSLVLWIQDCRKAPPFDGSSAITHPK